ncbi:MAG: ParB/RepB/Spo0J family partition protein [Chlamydiales bacterium]|nr:ParB/RepB/Spo0J family partition protein [Chlamydiales bacterium]
METTNNFYAQVLLEQICLNPNQPRKEFDDSDLKELADSIKHVGLIHPPTVLKQSEGHYELISGERRLRACKLAGLKQIPVFIREDSCGLSAQAALVENIQRVDLNPLEIAFALKSLMDENNMTQDQLAKKVGKKRSTVANYLRLIGLNEEIQKSISSKEISMGHAKILLSLDSVEKQKHLLSLIKDQRLTVRQTESTLRTCFSKKVSDKNSTRNVPPEIQDMEKRLQNILGRKVRLDHSKKGEGRLIIDYYSLEDFDELLDLLAGSQEAVL